MNEEYIDIFKLIRVGACPYHRSIGWFLSKWRSEGHSISNLIEQQLVPNPPHIHNPYPFIFRQLMAEFGDEHMQASGIEEAVVAP